MILTSFLYCTGMLASMMGQTFTALDQCYIISDLGISILDLMLASVIYARIYEFLLFLSGQEIANQPPELEDNYIFQ